MVAVGQQFAAGCFVERLHIFVPLDIFGPRAASWTPLFNVLILILFTIYAQSVITLHLKTIFQSEINKVQIGF